MRSFTPEPTVAVYTVDGAKGLNGVNVAWLPAEVTTPPTGLFEASRTKKVAALIVAGSTGSLKIARMEDSTAIPVAPLSGLVVVTFGGVISGTRVTTNVLLPTLPDGSEAVTVIALLPITRETEASHS
jgi:hypothetical protein